MQKLDSVKHPAVMFFHAFGDMKIDIPGSMTVGVAEMAADRFKWNTGFGKHGHMGMPERVRGQLTSKKVLRVTFEIDTIRVIADSPAIIITEKVICTEPIHQGSPFLV